MVADVSKEGCVGAGTFSGAPAGGEGEGQLQESSSRRAGHASYLLHGFRTARGRPLPPVHREEGPFFSEPSLVTVGCRRFLERDFHRHFQVAALRVFNHEISAAQEPRLES